MAAAYASPVDKPIQRKGEGLNVQIIVLQYHVYPL